MSENPEQKKYKYIVVDGTNLFFRCFYRSAKINKNTPMFKKFCAVPIQLAVSQIDNLLKVFGYQDTIVYILFDNPDSAYRVRHVLSEGKYKHSRKRNSASTYIYTILNIFQDLMKSYSDNCRIISSFGMEADDLTFPLKNSLELGYDNRCLFVSVDLDWARNIDEVKFCDWYNWYVLHDRASFKSKYGFYASASSVKMYKAIHGDESDCIENALPHLPKDILIDIVQSFETPEQLLLGLISKNYPQEWKLKIKDADRQIKVNYQMVDFYPVEKDLNEMMYVCQKRPEYLKIWYNALELSEFSDKLIDLNEDQLEEFSFSKKKAT